MDQRLGLGTGEGAVDLPKAKSTQVGASALLLVAYVSTGLSIPNLWPTRFVPLSR